MRKMRVGVLLTETNVTLINRISIKNVLITMNKFYRRSRNARFINSTANSLVQAHRLSPQRSGFVRAVIFSISKVFSAADLVSTTMSCDLCHVIYR